MLTAVNPTQPTQLTTVGDRLDALRLSIAALEGQLKLLEPLSKYASDCNSATDAILDCAAKALEEIWWEWWWLDVNRQAIEQAPAPSTDEAEALEHGGVR